MNDNLNEIIELLTAAREHYRERGGAVDDYSDGDGHTCALGSLISASLDDQPGMPAGTAVDDGLASRRPGRTGCIDGHNYNDTVIDAREPGVADLDHDDANIKDHE